MSDRMKVEVSCPRPHVPTGQVTMAHGGGGSVMHTLLEQVFYRAFGNEALNRQHDSAALELGGVRIAFTTDSFVVKPRFFPGGDIGSLAVHGTVNDLAMSGARPVCLSAAYILEEGYSLEELARVAESMQAAASRVGVPIVTGDTKVVNRGHGDGVYINTAGIGVIEHRLDIGPGSIRPGDAILVNGDLGRHGIAVMAVREGLEFETALESDSAPVAGAVLDLLDAGVEVHCLRDLTRGGLASALNELSQSAGRPIHIEEAAVPVDDAVRGACELLGLDPLYVANEGRFAAFVPERDAERALETLGRHADGAAPARIGSVGAEGPARVTLESAIGAARILDMLSGEQLPRIC